MQPLKVMYHHNIEKVYALDTKIHETLYAVRYARNMVKDKELSFGHLTMVDFHSKQCGLRFLITLIPNRKGNA